ncbi:MAG TPA: DUF998 domain-containing protein [Mycobacteriales bacterium]
MTTTTTTTACDPATATTRSLLAYGAVAGPLYVGVSVGLGLTRDGFDFGRHGWSLLTNGPYGWVQVLNFLLTGLCVVAFAVGLHRAGVGRRVSRLVGAYGVSLVAAAVLRADPAQGFPPGTPDGAPVSWHGVAHFAAGAVGFGCLIVACLVLGRRFAAAGRRGWAAFSRVTGIAFLAAFAGIASGSAGAGVVPAFVAAVLLVWTYLAALAAHLYRTAA